MGYVELPPPDTWEGGSADGTLEALPAFEPLRRRLEAALRAAFLMQDRVAAARRDGQLPPAPPAPPPGQVRMLVGDITPEEEAVMGADALADAADGARVQFALLEADGHTLPRTTEVHVMLTALPEWPDPTRPPWVSVFVPPPDDAAEPSRPEA